MRAPLIVLISAYAVSVIGLVLIPGVDEAGNPWRFDFFHAFYFVSFMASTIGFGEIPHEFNGAQRLWVSFCIWFTVIAWLYAIGRILSLIQDPAFTRATTEARFIRSVRRIRQPFTIVCGYGETGSLLVRAMAYRNLLPVVLDQEQKNIDSLIKEKYRGIRPAPGYPSCPDHTEKGALWKLLDVERNIGVELTENYAIYPPSSVAGLYFAHPESKYFHLGLIDRDQVVDFAKRKAISIEEAERWLRPNLGYDSSSSKQAV